MGMSTINDDFDLLLHCVENGYTEVVNYLKSKNINYNTALIKYAQTGNLKVVKYLIEEKSVNVQANDDEALRKSAENCQFEIVKYLIEKGANVHADNDEALRRSAEKGYFEVVKLLLENGANVNAQDDYALRNAAYYGHYDVVKILLEKGANIHAEDDYALLVATQEGHIDIVKLLVEKGANIHAEQDYALRWSAYYGHYHVVKLLVENGANINNAIKHCEHDSIRNILRKYIKKEVDLYKGQINDQTETDCGICLTEMNIEQEIVQCETCKKCVHNECNSKWETVNNSCVYCRN